MMRALGLDVGQKTIGLAITDELGIAAHPLDVLARHGTREDVTSVIALAIAREVSAIVVGIPYEMSGREGHRAKRVRVLYDALRAAMPPEMELHEQDERFTTAEAQRILIEADLSRARRKQVVDKQAAALILQGWLDRRRGSE
jgi:putative Holliday junction resolvase